MKSKILYVFLGNSIEGYDLPAHKSSGYAAFYLVDQDVMHSMNGFSCMDTVKFIHVDEADSIQELLSDLIHIPNIVICPLLHNVSTKDAEVELDNILEKVFVFTKMMYLPTIRHRESKIWFLDTSPLLAKSVFNQSPNIISLHCFSAGLKTLSKVMALELAKKNINVNLIQVNEENYHLKLESLLLGFSKNNRLYLTAQELLI
ncbi:hypothetical protein [Pelosinus baikalensis]|uniref:Uncharacterized protein n=1 Tax=Pelosinus baikalensis TaxID=2892015 RepID=A0ABS8HZ53_9FIRM|nr:hypothetical protein [Pelosinus baikalensis]MCC5468457.1 hypothetical protein [Pelosinus baikalensis]